MSSGFVSGGTADAPIERSDEWLEAQKDLDRKAEAARQAREQQGSSKSLFETLEANKGISRQPVNLSSEVPRLITQGCFELTSCQRRSIYRSKST